MIAALIHGVACAPVAVTWFRGTAARMHAAALARGRRTAYDSGVPDKEGNRLGRLNTKSAQTAPCGLFTCACLRAPSMSGGGGEALVACWFSFLCQSSNPAICRSPRLDAGCGVTAQKGGHMPSIIQSQTPSQIHTLALQRAIDAVNVASLGEECVDQLRAVFRAIVALSGNNPMIHDLAKVGYSMADSQHNLLDCSREDMEQNLLALKALPIDVVGGAA